MQKTYLNTKQVAELFKVDNSTIRRWSITGKIECQTTHGGHRKFLFKNIIKFLNENPQKKEFNASAILSVGDNNNSDYSHLISQHALDRDINQIDLIIMKLYFEGVKISEIFDSYIEKSLEKIQKLLDNRKISVAEEHIARKTISKTLDNLRSSIANFPTSDKSILCLNLENDIPDLAIDMIQIILEGKGYNVHNSGSNTSVADLKFLLEKSEFESIYIYLCNRQCCTATVKDNLKKTIKDLETINKLCNQFNIILHLGGPGTKYIDSKITFKYEKFNYFSELDS